MWHQFWFIRRTTRTAKQSNLLRYRCIVSDAKIFIFLQYSNSFRSSPRKRSDHFLLDETLYQMARMATFLNNSNHDCCIEGKRKHPGKHTHACSHIKLHDKLVRQQFSAASFRQAEKAEYVLRKGQQSDKEKFDYCLHGGVFRSAESQTVADYNSAPAKLLGLYSSAKECPLIGLCCPLSDVICASLTEHEERKCGRNFYSNLLLSFALDCNETGSRSKHQTFFKDQHSNTTAIGRQQSTGLRRAVQGSAAKKASKKSVECS